MAKDTGWQKWLLIPLVPTAIATLVRLLTQAYRFDSSAFVLKSGLLFHRMREIPYARIQHVELTQGPLQRWLGVATVTIQSGGNSEETEASLRVLSLVAAEDLRLRIHSERGSAGVEESATPVVLELAPRDLVLAGLAEGRGFLIVGGTLGLVWQGAELLGYDMPFASSFGGAELRRGVRFASSHFPSIGKLVLGVVVAIVLFRVLSIAWAAVKLHGFTLIRDGEILRSRFGLITRYAAAIPRNRVQTLTIMETPILRMTRRAAVKVQTAARFEAESGRVGAEWVAPVIEVRRLSALVNEVLPGIDPAALPWKPVHPDAWRREWRGAVIVTGAITLALASPLGWWSLAVPAVGLPYSWFSARGLARRYAYAVTDDAVAFRSGWINHKLSVVRMARVQSVKLEESFRDRRWKMASLGVDTAGSSGASHRVRVPYLSREVADELLSRVRQGAARHEPAW